MKIHKFEDLECWQAARELVYLVYACVNENGNFKKDYELCSQIKRAAVSVMSNIAEGFSRNSKKEFSRFLFISKASAAEVQSILYTALDLKFISKSDFECIYAKADKAARICSGLIKYLHARSLNKPNNPTNPITQQTQ